MAVMDMMLEKSLPMDAAAMTKEILLVNFKNGSTLHQVIAELRVHLEDHLIKKLFDELEPYTGVAWIDDLGPTLLKCPVETVEDVCVSTTIASS